MCPEVLCSQCSVHLWLFIQPRSARTCPLARPPPLCPHTQNGDSAAAVLRELLLLPPAWEPAYRTQQYNKAVARALEDREVKVCVCGGGGGHSCN